MAFKLESILEPPQTSSNEFHYVFIYYKYEPLMQHRKEISEAYTITRAFTRKVFLYYKINMY